MILSLNIFNHKRWRNQEEALVQLATITDQYQKSTIATKQTFVDQRILLVTMLANESQESSPSNLEKEFEEQEEAEAHKNKESCTEEESEWYQNYLQMFASHLLVPQEE